MLLSDIVMRHAHRTPGRVAVVEGERHVGFGELAGRISRLACALGRLAEPGDRVAVLARNRLAYVDCHYGVPAAGMILALVNFRLHPREWAWILNDCGARVLVVEQQFVTAIESVRADVPSLQHVVVIDAAENSAHQDYERMLNSARECTIRDDVDEGHPAWLVYTSGTTGFPKGAMLSHRSIVTSVVQSAIEFDVRPDDRMLMSFPLCHVAGYAVERCHLRGASVYLSPTFAPEDFLRLVARYRITASALAPTMLSTVMRHEHRDAYDTSSLRAVGFGSANLPVEVLRAAIDRFGPVLFSGFGMTELSGDVLVLPREEIAAAASVGDEDMLSACGRPMCLSDVRIFDDAQREVHAGSVGEIVVRSDQVLLGYWRNPEATAEAMTGGWFHTGDLGRRGRDGYITIVDRKKDMIITGGENVYSREVENAIAAIGGVVEVAVVGVPDAVWGEKVVAVVVANPHAELSAECVIEHCRGELAGYKLPKHVQFVPELPKNGTGKVQKPRVRELVQTWATGAPAARP